MHLFMPMATDLCLHYKNQNPGVIFKMGIGVYGVGQHDIQKTCCDYWKVEEVMQRIYIEGTCRL